MLRGTDLILADKPSLAAAQAAALVRLSAEAVDGAGQQAAVADQPISDMGTQGSGSPWWIWIILAVVVLLIAGCCVCACRKKKQREREERQKADGDLNQIIFQDAHDGLDEPLIT